ncbi:hypothetical protein QR98_0014250 [Sarcoptes scabiei]|uniref:Uncharacterized protein n=1 Tax=Sarcoptes scabiei TaxID=52283 RepID=A0A131ZWG6_SARSC|nr:hypothetical protein QR98_0014250 [Sarcoptes scabiei]
MDFVLESSNFFFFAATGTISFGMVSSTYQPKPSINNDDGDHLDVEKQNEKYLKSNEKQGNGLPKNLRVLNQSGLGEILIKLDWI